MRRAEPTRPRSTLALETLRRQIRDGRFANGAALPGERDLARQLAVSRSTLRNALATLVAEGVLAQRRGFGTVVASDVSPTEATRPSTEQGKLLLGLGDELLASHEHIAIEEETIGIYSALPDEMLVFRLAPDTKVCRVRRVLRDGGGERLAVERASVPLARVGGLSPVHRWPTLLQRSGFQPDCLTRRVRAATRHETPSGEAMDQTIGIVTEQFLYDPAKVCLIAWQLWQPATRIDTIASWSVGVTAAGLQLDEDAPDIPEPSGQA